MLYVKFLFSFMVFNRAYGNPMAEAEIFLVDSGTTKRIPRETRYFQTLTKKNGNIMTIARSNAHIVGTETATLVLPMGTQIFVKDYCCILTQTAPFLASKIFVRTVSM